MSILRAPASVLLKTDNKELQDQFKASLHGRDTITINQLEFLCMDYDNDKSFGLREFRRVSTVSPTSKTEWTGEGLPPVGTVCEWHPNVHGWVEVKILGHDGEDTWYRVKGEDHTQTCRNMAFFRPIRTPEQIAAEERDKAINQMAADCQHPMAPMMRESILSELYEAGYRKQVNP